LKTVTIIAGDNEPFVVRFQNKVLKDGVITWADGEVVGEVGKSQPYGIDENFRLVIEAGMDHQTDVTA
jgi:hypothetical protein